MEPFKNLKPSVGFTGAGTPTESAPAKKLSFFARIWAFLKSLF